MQGVRSREIKCLKKDRDFYGLDLDSPFAKMLKWSFLLLVPTIGLAFLVSSSSDFLFQKEVNRKILSAYLFAPYLLHALFGSSWVVWKIVSGRLAQTVTRKHSYAVFRSELFGMSEEQLESDSVIDYLNSRFQLALPKDPFRIWPEPFFKRNGEVWIMGFEGKRFSLRVDKGTQDTYERIACLLQNPDKDVSCFELAYKFHGEIKVEAEARDVSGEHVAPSSWEPKFSNYTHDQLNDAKKELKKQINDATERDDLFENAIKNDASRMELEKLEKQYKEISNYLNGTYDKNGQERGPRSESSKATETVRKGVNRFINRVRKFHPDLAEYLDKSISYGKGLVAYRPPDEITWDIQY